MADGAALLIGAGTAFGLRTAALLTDDRLPAWKAEPDERG